MKTIRIKPIGKILLMVLLAACIAGYFLIHNIHSEITLEAGTVPSGQDFLIRDLGIAAHLETDPGTICVNIPGSYPVQIRYLGLSYACTVHIQDTVAPEATTRHLTFWQLYAPDPWDFIVELTDATQVTAVYDTPPDMTSASTQRVSILLTDLGGNTTRVNANLTLVYDDVAPAIHGVSNITYYAGLPLDYLEGVTITDDQDPKPQVTIIDHQVDLTTSGTYPITYLAEDSFGNSAQASATMTVIVDNEAPVFHAVQDITCCVGENPDFLSGVSVHDNYDSDPVFAVLSQEVDTSQAGSYPLRYITEDFCGNSATITVTVNVIQDTVAPELVGVTPLSVYVGSTIAYRKGIVVTDNHKTAPASLTIDSSAVDLSQPGTYPIVYTATDTAGNVTQKQTTVTVYPKPKTYVDEAEIFALADSVLNQIITDDMTMEQQIWAVFRWVQGAHSYTGTSDKTDRLQAAYKMMTSGKGDCYSYHAVTTLLFDRLNIPYIAVQRSQDSQRESRHYWSMVTLDGGKTWYHFDATPRVQTGPETCLVTDAVLNYYNKLIPGYYDRDHSLYPATPKE